MPPYTALALSHSSVIALQTICTSCRSPRLNLLPLLKIKIMDERITEFQRLLDIMDELRE